MTEQQPFEVVRRYPGFDLRRYPAHLVAQVTVTSSFDRAGNIAFRSLFGYITGQNRSRSSVAMTAPVVQSVAGSEKVAMTAPVVQRAKGDGDYVIAFVLPAALTADTAPAPTNPDVEICTIPTSLTAAKEYGGRWSQSSYERHCAELLDAVATAGLRPVGAPRFARFDPPFKPGSCVATRSSSTWKRLRPRPPEIPQIVPRAGGRTGDPVQAAARAATSHLSPAQLLRPPRLRPRHVASVTLQCSKRPTPLSLGKVKDARQGRASR